jgi:hypothetical protein
MSIASNPRCNFSRNNVTEKKCTACMIRPRPRSNGCSCQASCLWRCSRNCSRWHTRSTLFVCFNNSSSCKKRSFTVLSVVLLLFRTHRPHLSTSFPWTIVQRERYRLRGASPTRHQCSTLCTKNRRGENMSWAGDVRRQDPFEGEWEQIFSWLVANPERSSGDIFREL